MAYVPPKLKSASKPLARGQKDEPPAMRLPTPEELGLKAQPVGETLDWAKVERRLESLRATGFQVERTGDGFRCSVQLNGRTIAGSGVTRADAVRSVMSQISG